MAFRAREYVLRCVESVLRHADLSAEVVVVDDGSDDGTAEAVRERFPSVTVIAKPRNEGLARGRNDAVRNVRGRLVLMLDADTELCAGSLSALAGVLDSHPEVGLVGPKLTYPDGELQLSCHRYPPFFLPFVRRGPYARLRPEPRSYRRFMMKDWDHAHERPVVWVIGAAQMWRADLPKLIGDYDERVSSYGGEDKDWCLRVWKAGLEVRYVPQAVVVHHYQRVTRRRLYGRTAFRALRDWYYLQLKHWELRGDPRLREAER